MKMMDVAEPALVFSPGDKVSKVASEMYRSRKDEAVVADGKQYVGTIAARELVKRNMPNPDKTSLSGLKAIINTVGPLSPDADVREVVNSVLINNLKSIPVMQAGKFYMVSKLGLVRMLPKDSIKGKTAADVMVFPYCISMDDSVDVARSIIRQMNVQRVAIIGKDDRAEGMLDSLDLLRTISEKKRMHIGEKGGDKIRLGEILASSRSIMQSSVLRASPNTPLTQLVKSMIEKKADTVIIEEEKFQGIVTPVQILKLLSREVSGIRVTVSGMQDEDVFIKTVVDEQLRNEIRKLGKSIPIEYMVLNVSRYEEDGKRIKYSVRGRLITHKGSFFADDHAWDVTKAVRGVLQKFEAEIIRKLGKSRDVRQGSKGPQKDRF
jgi:predicted transcriptional regulator